MKFGLRGRVLSVHRVLLTQVLKVISGVIGCISMFRQASISKTAGRRAKRSESWALGVSIKYTPVFLTLKCLRSFWGHSVHF